MLRLWLFRKLSVTKQHRKVIRGQKDEAKVFNLMNRLLINRTKMQQFNAIWQDCLLSGYITQTLRVMVLMIQISLHQMMTILWMMKIIFKEKPRVWMVNK
ncbi:hypothetical protein QZH41_010775 [Actinostola sp. cb2023]|nr:hypothetical protein QZH41_010775 [Actinostola sp. cb2023]